MAKKKLELKHILPFYVTKMLKPPDWIQMLDEAELKDEVKPDSTLWQLRIRLWGMVEEIMQSQALGLDIQPIELKDLHKDICSRAIYLNRIRDERRGAFICRPISDFQNQLDALLTVGAARLWEIMTIPIRMKNKAGDEVIDMNAAKMVVSAFKMLKDTKYGGPVQRVIKANVKPESIGDNKPVLIDDEIKDLEDRLDAGKVVDVAGN